MFNSIHFDMKTLHQVSLKLRDLEKNLSSSFLVLSHKLVFVMHLLLASVHTPHQVSPILQDSEKNGSSSFLVQSDKLLLFLHFPLVPVYTVVKLASYVMKNCPFTTNLQTSVAAQFGQFLIFRKLFELMFLISQEVSLQPCVGVRISNRKFL